VTDRAALLFGPLGPVAFWALLGSIALALLFKLAKITFDLLRLVAFPAVTVALACNYLTPWPFQQVLPVVVILFSLVFLFKS
jgi:hypothetical protein